MNPTMKMLWIAALASPLLIAGCGGGGGGGNNGPVVDMTRVPDSAGASVADFLAFIASLPSDDETSEPLTIGDNFAVPANEDGEPQPLI